MIYYATIAGIFWLTATIFLLINTHRVGYLKKIKTQPFQQPSVSIIIAVRNEEAKLAEALQSVCNLNYSNYKVIILNDRSTDNTANILKEFETRFPFIKVTTITELPPGWLGKNNAMYQGYKANDSEWMLFTDADIVYDKDALTKAMYAALQKKADHIVVLPEVYSPSLPLNSIMETFKLLLEFSQRPWAVSNKKSSASIGVGAFNMVKVKAYEQAGTHAAIALRPDDDLKLGEKIKRAGFSQHVFYGDQQVGLEWYSNIKEFINGLMKNSFAVVDYNIWRAMANALALLVFFIAPLPLLLIWGHAHERLIAAGILVLQMVLYAFRKGTTNRWWHALFIAYAGYIMFYIIFKAAYLTTKQGGIYWRGTFYSLKDLKKGL